MNGTMDELNYTATQGARSGSAIDSRPRLRWYCGSRFEHGRNRRRRPRAAGGPAR